MSAFALVHHVYRGDPHYKSVAELAKGWVGEVVPDAPLVTEEGYVALRAEVTGLRADSSWRTCWHHCDGNAWDAVLVLHRRGLHADADALARFLHWCDQRFTGRDEGMWELRRSDVAAGRGAGGAG